MSRKGPVMIGNEATAHISNKENSRNGTSDSLSDSALTAPLDTEKHSDIKNLCFDNKPYSISVTEIHNIEEERGASVGLDTIKLAFMLKAEEKGLVTYHGKGTFFRNNLMKSYEEIFLPRVIVEKCDSKISQYEQLNIKSKSKRENLLNTATTECESMVSYPESDCKPAAEGDQCGGGTDHITNQMPETNHTDINSNLDYREVLRSLSRKTPPSPLVLSGSSNKLEVFFKSSPIRGFSDETNVTTAIQEEFVQEKHVIVNNANKLWFKKESDEDRLSDNFEKQGHPCKVKTTLAQPPTQVVNDTNGSQMTSSDSLAHTDKAICVESKMKSQSIENSATYVIEKKGNYMQNKKRKPRRKLYTARRRTKWRKEWNRKIHVHGNKTGAVPKVPKDNCKIYDFAEDPKTLIETCRKRTLNSNGKLFQVRSTNKRRGKTQSNQPKPKAQIGKIIQIPDLSSTRKVPKLRIKKRLILRRSSEDGCSSQYVSMITEEVSTNKVPKKRRKMSKPQKSATSIGDLKEFSSAANGLNISSLGDCSPEDTLMAQKMSDQSARLASEFKNHNWLESKILGNNIATVSDRPDVIPKAKTHPVETMNNEDTRSLSESTEVGSFCPSGEDQHSSGMVISTQHPSLRKEATNQHKIKRRKVRNSNSSSQLDLSSVVGSPVAHANGNTPNTGSISLHPSCSIEISHAASMSRVILPIQPLPPSIIVTKAQPELPINYITESKHTIQTPLMAALLPTMVQPQQISQGLPRSKGWPTPPSGPVTLFTVEPEEPRPSEAQVRVMLVEQSNGVHSLPILPNQTVLSNVPSKERSDMSETHIHMPVSEPPARIASSQPPRLLTPPNVISTTTVISKRNANRVNKSVNTNGGTIVTTKAAVESNEEKSNVNEAKREQTVQNPSSYTAMESLNLPDIIPGDHDLPEDLLVIKREFEKQKKELEILFELSQQKEKEKIIISQKTRDTYLQMKTIGEKVKEHYEQELQKESYGHNSEKQTTKNVSPDNEQGGTSTQGEKSQTEHSPESILRIKRDNDTSKKTGSLSLDKQKDLSGPRNAQFNDINRETIILTNPLAISTGKTEQANINDTITSMAPVITQIDHNWQPALQCRPVNKQSRRKSQPQPSTIDNEPVVKHSGKPANKTFLSPGWKAPVHNEHTDRSVLERANTNKEKSTSVNKTKTSADFTEFYGNTPTASKSLFELEKLSYWQGEPMTEDTSFEVALHQGKIHPAFPFNEQRQLAHIQRSINKSNLSDAEKRLRRSALYQMQEQQQLLFGKLAAMNPASRRQLAQHNQMISMQQSPLIPTEVKLIGQNVSQQISESERDRQQHVQVKYAMEVALLQQRMRQIQMELNEVTGQKLNKRRKRKRTHGPEECDSAGPTINYPKSSSSGLRPNIESGASLKTSQADGTSSSVLAPVNSQKEPGHVQAGGHLSHEPTQITHVNFPMSDHQNQQQHSETCVQQAVPSYNTYVNSSQTLCTQTNRMDNTTSININTPQHQSINRATMMLGGQRPELASHTGLKLSTSSVSPMIHSNHHVSMIPQVGPSPHYLPKNPPATTNQQYSVPGHTTIHGAGNAIAASASLQAEEEISNQPMPQMQMAFPNGMMAMPRGHSITHSAQIHQPGAAHGQVAGTGPVVSGAMLVPTRFQMQQQFPNGHVYEQQQRMGSTRCVQSAAPAPPPALNDQGPCQEISLSALSTSFQHSTGENHKITHKESLPHNSGSRQFIKHGDDSLHHLVGNITGNGNNRGNGRKKLCGKVVCHTCRKPAQFLCSGCRQVAYCSVPCQASSWKTHCRECCVPEPALL